MVITVTSELKLGIAILTYRESSYDPGDLIQKLQESLPGLSAQDLVIYQNDIPQTSIPEVSRYSYLSAYSSTVAKIAWYRFKSSGTNGAAAWWGLTQFVRSAVNAVGSWKSGRIPVSTGEGSRAWKLVTGHMATWERILNSPNDWFLILEDDMQLSEIGVLGMTSLSDLLPNRGMEEIIELSLSFGLDETGLSGYAEDSDFTEHASGLTRISVPCANTTGALLYSRLALERTLEKVRSATSAKSPESLLPIDWLISYLWTKNPGTCQWYSVKNSWFNQMSNFREPKL
jgi:hypothetical protein